MKSVPAYNDCMCDDCMVKYFHQGLIHKGTPAYDDVMGILKTKVISGFPTVEKSVLTKE